MGSGPVKSKGKRPGPQIRAISSARSAKTGSASRHAVDRGVVKQNTVTRPLAAQLGCPMVKGGVPLLQPQLGCGENSREQGKQAVVLQRGAAQVGHAGGEQGAPFAGLVGPGQKF